LGEPHASNCLRLGLAERGPVQRFGGSFGKAYPARQGETSRAVFLPAATRMENAPVPLAVAPRSQSDSPAPAEIDAVDEGEFAAEAAA